MDLLFGDSIDKLGFNFGPDQVQKIDFGDVTIWQNNFGITSVYVGDNNGVPRGSAVVGGSNLVLWVLGSVGATFDIAVSAGVTATPASGEITGTVTADGAVVTGAFFDFVVGDNDVAGNPARTLTATVTPTGITVLTPPEDGIVSVTQPAGPALLNPNMTLTSFSWDDVTGDIIIMAEWDGPGTAHPASFNFNDAMGDLIPGGTGIIDTSDQTSPGTWTFTTPATYQSWTLNVFVLPSGAYDSGSSGQIIVNRGDSF